MDEPKMCEQHGIAKLWKPGSQRWRCTECQNERNRRRWRQDPIYREKKKRAVCRWEKQNPEKVKAKFHRYDRTEKGKARSQRHNQTEKGKARYLRWNASNPEKRAAHNAVNKALKSGDLIKSNFCKFCGDNPTESHHHSYAKKHWLDVEWLCRKCHRALHRLLLECLRAEHAA